MPDLPERRLAPVIYVADFRDPADWFDLAYLLRSPVHDLRGIYLPNQDHEVENRFAELSQHCGQSAAVLRGFGDLRSALQDAPGPLNIISTGGGHELFGVLTDTPALFREKVARLFLVGGHANDYARGRAGERLPIDPRLKEALPKRFSPHGDERIALFDRSAFLALLTSGEGVIWLPRDICLWRFAASGMLEGGGPVCDFLLRRLREENGDADAPVALSSLPAFLLAVQPDPFAWMRLFRAVAARVEVNEETSDIASLLTNADRPNLYAVIAIDSAALSKFFAAGLRDR